jgi:hypothetical protein
MDSWGCMFANRSSARLVSPATLAMAALTLLGWLVLDPGVLRRIRVGEWARRMPVTTLTNSRREQDIIKSYDLYWLMLNGAPA